jgi:hypothetical protein
MKEIWKKGRSDRNTRKKTMDDLKETRGYSKIKDEALDSTLWRTHSGRGH